MLRSLLSFRCRLFTTHGDFSPSGFVVETDFVSEWGHKARTKTIGIRVATAGNSVEFSWNRHLPDCRLT